MPLQVLQLGPGQKFDPDFKTSCTPPWQVNPFNYKPLCSSGNQQPLWTSSYDYEAKSTEWLRYCARGYEDDIGEQAVIFEVSPSARVMHILNEDDFETALGLYPGEPSNDMKRMGMGRPLDWNAVAQEYDGFHVGREAISTSELREWSVESTVWFNPKVLTVKQIVDIQHYCDAAGHGRSLSPQERKDIKQQKEQTEESFGEKLDQWLEHRTGPQPQPPHDQYRFRYEIPRP